MFHGPQRFASPRVEARGGESSCAFYRRSFVSSYVAWTLRIFIPPPGSAHADCVWPSVRERAPARPLRLLQTLFPPAYLSSSSIGIDRRRLVPLQQRAEQQHPRWPPPRPPWAKTQPAVPSATERSRGSWMCPRFCFGIKFRHRHSSKKLQRVGLGWGGGACRLSRWLPYL